MIKELTIECEEITRVETNQRYGNNIGVTLSMPLMEFLQDLEAEEIIRGLDADEVLQAVVDIYGLEFIHDWHDGLGK